MRTLYLEELDVRGNFRSMGVWIEKQARVANEPIILHSEELLSSAPRITTVPQMVSYLLSKCSYLLTLKHKVLFLESDNIWTVSFYL